MYIGMVCSFCLFFWVVPIAFFFVDRGDHRKREALYN